MVTTPALMQLAIALIPAVGMVVLAADRMSSKKSVTMRTVIKVLGLTILPAVTILGLQGLLDSPMVAGFLGIMTGYVLNGLVATD